MESFTYTTVTKDTYPVAVCGLCTDGYKNECIKSVSELKKTVFGNYSSAFTIDYRLGKLLGECLNNVSDYVFSVGATIKINGSEVITGGVFGSLDDSFLSAEETIGLIDNFLIGTKPGKGAFCAEIENNDDREMISKFYELNFDGSQHMSEQLYHKLKEKADKFIMMSDGSGSCSYGLVADMDNFVTLNEVETRFSEQKNYFGFKRIGIMGGTFNPIHNGHLIAAQTACDELKLDKVIFIPTGNTSYKESDYIVAGENRYTMTSLAVSSNENFCVSSIEIDRIGIAYTVDTIEQLKGLCDEDSELFFIVGADVIKAVSSWKGFSRLCKLCTFVVVTRPGYNKKEADLEVAQNAQVKYLEVPALDISSSSIRESIKRGKSVKYLLPDSVEQYIYLHDFYKNDSSIIKKYDSELIDKILKLIN